jgi:60 kDa SS-A/Ro ribonucleoprotein
MSSTTFAKHASTKVTPQTRPIPGRESEMAKNDSGGFVFKLDKWNALERFLVLGTSEGSHIVNQETVVVRACESLMACVLENPRRVVDTLRTISEEGRALKNDYALFALAYVMAHATEPDDKFYARQALNSVARIGTHILHFAEFIEQLKGWGTGTRKAFKSWYLSKTPEQLAFQFIKYQQRDGWSHRDILRLSHAKGTPEQNSVFNYITKRNTKDAEGKSVITDVSDLPQQLKAFHEIPNMGEKGVIDLVERFNLPREAIPTEMLQSMDMWKALLPRMGLTAMIRSLGKMTSIGLISNKEDCPHTNFIVKSLKDFDLLRKARIHPMQVLFAMKTYSSGKGFRGALSWNPAASVLAALEVAFEASFAYVEPSNKKIWLNLDVSGSMHHHHMFNSNVTCREAAVTMAMITARHEEHYRMFGFSSSFIPLDHLITKNMTFAQSMKNMDGIPFARTDCALPMVHALQQKADVDVFVVYTDNETYFGNIHPVQALAKYRKDMNKPHAKLVVVGMLGSPFTIADPKDPYMLDVVGFDTEAPQVISSFAAL